MSKRRKFCEVFRREAVELTHQSGITLSQVACDIGIGAGLPGRWRRELTASYQPLAEARKDAFDYIERFHNPRMQRRIDSREKQSMVLTQQSAKTG